MLSEKKNDAKKIDFKPSKPMYLIDFVDVQQWQKTIEQQPSLVHFGSVYFKNNPQSLTCCP